ENRFDSCDDQERSLRGMADALETAGVAGFRQRGEVHERGDVLQARIQQRIGVRAVAIVAYQRAVRSLGQVELAARVAIVDEQRRAALQVLGDGLDPPRQLWQYLRTIAAGECAELALQMPHRARNQRIGGTIAAKEASVRVH